MELLHVLQFGEVRKVTSELVCPKVEDTYNNMYRCVSLDLYRAKFRNHAHLRSRPSETISVGIDPVKLFCCADAYSKLFKPPSSVGIDPVNPFLSKLKETRLRMLASAVNLPWFTFLKSLTQICHPSQICGNCSGESITVQIKIF